MKDEPLKDISEDRTKNMTANAIRQARYAGKMRAKGMKKLTLWVTPEEEWLVRACLMNAQRSKGIGD